MTDSNQHSELSDRSAGEYLSSRLTLNPNPVELENAADWILWAINRIESLEEQLESLRETVAVAIEDVLLIDSPEGDSPRNIAANLREALVSNPASEPEAS